MPLIWISFCKFRIIPFQKIKEEPSTLIVIARQLRTLVFEASHKESLSTKEH